MDVCVWGGGNAAATSSCSGQTRPLRRAHIYVPHIHRIKRSPRICSESADGQYLCLSAPFRVSDHA